MVAAVGKTFGSSDATNFPTEAAWLLYRGDQDPAGWNDLDWTLDGGRFRVISLGSRNFCVVGGENGTTNIKAQIINLAADGSFNSKGSVATVSVNASSVKGVYLSADGTRIVIWSSPGYLRAYTHSGTTLTAIAAEFTMASNPVCCDLLNNTTLVSFYDSGTAIAGRYYDISVSPHTESAEQTAGTDINTVEACRVVDSDKAIVFVSRQASNDDGKAHKLTLNGTTFVEDTSLPVFEQNASTAFSISDNYNPIGTLCWRFDAQETGDYFVVFLADPNTVPGGEFYFSGIFYDESTDTMSVPFGTTLTTLNETVNANMIAEDIITSVTVGMSDINGRIGCIALEIDNGATETIGLQFLVSPLKAPNDELPLLTNLGGILDDHDDPTTPVGVQVALDISAGIGMVVREAATATKIYKGIVSSV